MSEKIDYYPALMPGGYYHLFNRGNNRENVFYRSENTAYFLKKYNHYLQPLLDTYAYSLLPNHFHLLVRVKPANEIIGVGAAQLPGFKNLENLVSLGDGAAIARSISEMVSNQFRLMFMSYAKAINKQEQRVGSLFQKNFKRVGVRSEAHLVNLVLYLHANPQLHGLCDDFREWTDSSYLSHLSERHTRLCRDEVMGWFGGRAAFVQRHNSYIDWKTAGAAWIEDNADLPGF